MVTTRTTSDVKLIRCTIGEATFCLDIERVRGIERIERLARLPSEQSPGCLRSGGIEWDVFQPSRWFGSTAGQAGRYVVLLESRHGRFGLLVDRAIPVDRVAGRSVVDSPHLGSTSRWASGVFRSEDGPIVVLDVDRLYAPALPKEMPVQTRLPSVFKGANGDRTVDRWITIGRQEHPCGRVVVLALPASVVVEVIEARAPVVVPGTAAHFHGLIEWRGAPLVVADPARWVGLASTSDSSRLVVARFAGTRIGLVAGATVKVLPCGLPCIVGRHRLQLDLKTILCCFDTTETTIVVPDWQQFAMLRN